MNLWESYKVEATKELENELIKKYRPLIYRVWKGHFKTIDLDDCYSHGLEALWKAVQNWRKLGKIGLEEHEFIRYAIAAIWNRINDSIRASNTNKRKAIRTNIESFEHIRGLIDELESTEEKRERVAKQLEQIFKKRRSATYAILLKHYGEGIPWTELWEDAGYNSADSIRSSMNEIMDELQEKARYLVS